MEEKQTEKNLISLLDYETELAEKTTQRNGLNLQIIVFALGAIIWMFLSTILEQKPNLHKSLPLYLTLIFLWPFVNIFVSTIDGFALSKKPLLLSCRVSHIFLKMSLSQLVASLIFYFSLFVLWLFTPFAASLKNLFIPTTLLFLACYFVIIISQTSFYSKADPLFVPKISSYIEICVLLMLLFFSAITSILICFLSIEMSLPDVKFSLLAFAITFLLDNMLSIHSQNRAMGSIVDIRRSYADNKINNKAVEKRIRFYITGETYGRCHTK